MFGEADKQVDLSFSLKN
uniref:Uncharacterized protein n=1 Tax=Arundo donax TaxID=35708 RepID=A0A0A9HD48_ARUDO